MNARRDHLLCELLIVDQLSECCMTGNLEVPNEKEQILQTIVEHDTMDLQTASDKITKEISSKKD